MRKKFTQNDNQTSNATTFRKEYLEQYAIKQNNVDINTLLNRVKIDERNEKKQKILFFFSVILVIIMLGSFISILK